MIIHQGAVRIKVFSDNFSGLPVPGRPGGAPVPRQAAWLVKFI